VEGEENESDTVEEAEPTLSEPEEAVASLPEDTSSQSDGKKQFPSIMFCILYCKI
jgi:hypothetical protein